MTLKEKFDDVFIENWLADYSTECEKIADDFAIGFVVWLDKNKKELRKIIVIEQLLEIYKKEKGL